MATNTAENRSWEWTPPAFVNKIMATLLRLPLVHRALSKQMLLISFTGRKSQKRYTTPVGYWREGNKVTILTKRFRTWWRNFEQPAPVTLRIEGRDYEGRATAYTDLATIVPMIHHRIEKSPREAEIFEIRMVDGKVDDESVRAIAPKLVVIEVILA
jgi:hypothetical protein